MTEDPADVVEDPTDITAQEENPEETVEEAEPEEVPLDVQAVETEEAVIEEGYYQITSEKEPLRAFAVPASGSNFVVDNPEQNALGTTFKVIPLGENLYEILNFSSNMALTLSSGSPAYVTQSAYKGNDNQKWYILKGKSVSGEFTVLGGGRYG